MFDIWRLKRQRSKLQGHFKKRAKALEKKNASREEFMELDADEHYGMQDIEDAIDYRISVKLLDEARSLDVEIPPHDEQGMWARDDSGEYAWLTSKARCES